MKHVKIFESFDKKYEEIGFFKWREILDGCTFSNFSDREKNVLSKINLKEFYINGIFGKKDYPRMFYHIDINRYGLNIFLSKSELGMKSYGIEYRILHILKLDDDWFICDYKPHKPESYNSDDNKFFKCDQLDGLLDLLKDLDIF
jgi:hypothetical protein